MGKAFVSKLAKEGARNPEALAAWIGRKKHGAEFGKLVAAGRGKKVNKSSDSSDPPNSDGKSRGQAESGHGHPRAAEATAAIETAMKRLRLFAGIREHYSSQSETRLDKSKLSRQSDEQLAERMRLVRGVINTAENYDIKLNRVDKAFLYNINHDLMGEQMRRRRG